MRSVLVFLLLFIYFFSIIAQGQTHPQPPHPIPSGDDGNSRMPDIDNFIRQVENWKQNYPDKFDYLKSLLYKEPFTTQKYVPPAVWVYYPPSNNITVSRDEQIRIGAVILNQNPIEIRRALYLNLEIMEPGDIEFKPANTATQIVQVNDYGEKTNTTMRIFPDFTSFSYLKRVGYVKFRIKVSDGIYNYYSSIQSDSPKDGCYGELKMKVYNIPPQINNDTMNVTPDPANWDDYIEYTASLQENGLNTSSTTNTKQETVQVTLHVLNNGTEINNITKPFEVGDLIKFSTKDKNIFDDKDSGKNFTYRFSCNDQTIGDINTTWSKEAEGPHLRPNPMIKVKDFTGQAEDENYYWWQKYNFALWAKSQRSGGEMLTVTLYTDTTAHPRKSIASQTIYIPGDNFTEVAFQGVKPFDVADSNQTFRYYFTYSLPDETGNTQSAIFEGSNRINPKLVMYAIYSPEMIVNLLLIIALALAGGFIIEQRFYRKGSK